MKKLRIGIVGTGGMAKIHASGYMLNTDALVTGVCSITRDLAESFAAGNWSDVAYSEGNLEAKCLYPIKHIFDSYKDMAESEDIDAVSIVVPNVLHFEIAQYMLGHKKHVLVEKPLAVNAELAQMLVDTAHRNGVLLATGHMWRYHKDVEFIREVVLSGELGEIVQTKSYSEHLRWSPTGWFQAKAQAGGGALIDMGVHALDTTRYILGDPAMKSLYAAVATRFTKAEVDDYAQIMIKHQNGVVSLFESGWNLPYISGLEAATEIWGTKGYARLFPTEVLIQKFGNWGRFTLDKGEPHTSVEPYYRQVDEFVAACLGKGTCRVSYDIGLNVIRICDAAYLSAKDDCLVRFD